MSTKLLRSKDALQEDIFTGVELVGEKGPDTQASACDYDVKNNVLFYTQLCKNAIGCWNTDKPFTPENNLVLMKDCNVLEFPNDIKIDLEKDPNLWILSNRQSRFLYGNNMDFNQVNFRVLTAPTSVLIRGTPCEKPSALGKVFGCFSAKKNARTNSADSKKNARGSNTSRTQIESLPCPTDGKVGKEGESCCKSPRNSR